MLVVVVAAAVVVVVVFVAGETWWAVKQVSSSAVHKPEIAVSGIVAVQRVSFRRRGDGGWRSDW